MLHLSLVEILICLVPIAVVALIVAIILIATRRNRY